MGTEGGGNMFPGVSRPFGMTKLGKSIRNREDVIDQRLRTKALICTRARMLTQDICPPVM